MRVGSTSALSECHNRKEMAQNKIFGYSRFIRHARAQSGRRRRQTNTHTVQTHQVLLPDENLFRPTRMDKKGSIDFSFGRIVRKTEENVACVSSELQSTAELHDAHGYCLRLRAFSFLHFIHSLSKPRTRPKLTIFCFEL